MSAISPIAAPPPPVAERDPRPRLAAFVVFVVAVMFALPSIAAMSAALGFAIGLHFGTGNTAAVWVRDVKRLWPFVLLIIAINGWAVDGESAVSFAGRTLATKAGLAQGVFFSIRLAALYLAMVLLVRSTPPEELAAGLHAAVKPLSRTLARRVAFHGFVAMSFVPVFAAEFQRVRIAQSFRGGTLAGSLTQRVQAARLLIVPLILSAVHRSGQLAVVSELRGLEDRFGDILVIRSPRWSEVALPLVTLAVVVAARVWLV